MDKKSKHKTAVKKKTLNPEFNEVRGGGGGAHEASGKNSQGRAAANGASQIHQVM